MKRYSSSILTQSKMKTTLKRLITAILIISLLAACGAMNTSVFAADSLVHEVIHSDMDNYGFDPDYTTEDSEYEISSLNSISGKSLMVKKLNVGWRNLITDEYTSDIEFKFKCISGYDGVFMLNASFNGKTDKLINLISIYVSDSVLRLYDNDNKEIYEFTFNTIFKIRLSNNRSSDTFSIYINDTRIDKSVTLDSSVYNIDEINLVVDNDSDTMDLILDDIRVFTEGKPYPQLYSSQEKGELYEESFDAYTEPTTYSFFINRTPVNFTRNIIAEDKALFIPAKELYTNLGMDYVQDDNTITVKNDNLNLIFTVDSNVATINGNNIVLNTAVKQIDGVVYVPLHLINESLNAKVWWDEGSMMVVVTTGKYKNDNVLRIINGKLYMNGEPYYEISYYAENLFNSFYDVYTEDPENFKSSTTYIQAENLLNSIYMNGFKSIRTNIYIDDNYYVSNSVTDKDKYYNCVSEFFDLCDKYDIKVVPCMGLSTKMHLSYFYTEEYGWIKGNEKIVDLVSDTSATSRAEMIFFLEEFVAKYKERNTILFWELSDSANTYADLGASNNEVAYSLLQLADFYTDCYYTIRKADMVRIISTGDSIPKASQWHLLKATMAGSGEDFTFDTNAERLNVFNLLCRDTDIISIHGKNIGISSNPDSYYSDSSGAKVLLTYQRLKIDALTLGKALYDGAINGMSETGRNDEESIQLYLKSMIDADIQLAYWKVDRTDTLNSEFVDGNIGKVISDSNHELKQTYLVNSASQDNTFTSWPDPDFEVFDPENINTGETDTTRQLVMSGIKILGITSIVVIVIALTLFLIHKKESANKRRNYK